MGTIIPRKMQNGKTRWLARIRKVGGKHISQTFETKGHAQAWMASIENTINEGKFTHIIEAKKHRMDEVITRYIEFELPKKPKSIKKQTAQLLWWKERMGHTLLANVTPSLIVQCREELKNGATQRGEKRSTATVNRYLAVLSHLFTVAAREWQLISDSPMKKVSKLKEPRGRDRILKPRELQQLFLACKQSDSPLLYLFVKIALATGARENEILTLKWSDVDLETGKAVLRETKNGRIRTLHLSPGILELLKQSSENKLGLIFRGKRPDKPVNLRYAWKRALEAAKIADFRIHDMRHQAASMMATNGSSDAELRAYLGHLSASQIMRYVHYRESAMAANVNKMNDLLQQIEDGNGVTQPNVSNNSKR